MKDLPEEFVSRLKAICGDYFDAVMPTFSRQRSLTGRVNTLKASIEECHQALADLNVPFERVSWMDEALEFSEEYRSIITSSEIFNEGKLYIQGLSSMIPVLALDPQPGETVLDLAAAPGGKTTHIAMLMKNEGRLSAVEPVKGRFFKLKGNLETQGATMVKTYLMDGRAVGRKCPEMFDRILLDAPCSSEARISALNPDSWNHWSVRKVGEASKKQRGLISSAWHSLKPGGKLVYCTCSFAPEENELIVQRLLKRNEDAELEEIAMPVDNYMNGLSEWKGKAINPEIQKTIRVLPNEKMDGFFLASIRKLV